eukprot:11161602-Lingulodinium_polyedra.AAC.1
MLFNLIEAKVLELAERRVIEDGMATHVPCDEAAGPLAERGPQAGCTYVPAVQLSYVDDAVFTATDRHPGQL